MSDMAQRIAAMCGHGLALSFDKRGRRLVVIDPSLGRVTTHEPPDATPAELVSVAYHQFAKEYL